MIKIDLYGSGQRMVAVSPGAQIFGRKSRSDVSGRFFHSGCPISMWDSMKIMERTLEDDVGVVWKNSHLTVLPTSFSTMFSLKSSSRI